MNQPEFCVKKHGTCYSYIMRYWRIDYASNIRLFLDKEAEYWNRVRVDTPDEPKT